jgi:hypothetical protein
MNVQQTPTDIPTGKDLHRALLSRILRCSVAGIVSDEMDKADLMAAVGSVRTQSQVATLSLLLAQYLC